jgi:hypothetical protein
MRAAANVFLAQATLPRYGTVQRCGNAFSCDLWQLVPQVEQLARSLPEDDVPARVALAGVGEACRRLEAIECPGLEGEFERVKRLARSVVALCDHHTALTGVTMCLACDEPIASGEESMSYDVLSPSGGAALSGRIHARCTHIIRRSR